MRSSKCTMAAITAFIMTAAMAASAAPAFAYEGAEALINSYGNPVAQDIAEYCLDNGMSLEETKELVDGYASRHPVTVARSATVTNRIYSDYYNTNAISDSDHYMAVIVTDTTSRVSGHYFSNFESNLATYNDSTSLCRGYDTASGVNLTVNSYGAYLRIDMAAPAGVTTASEAAFVKHKLLEGADASGEDDIYRAITFSPNDSLSGKVAYDTYAVGDVDHDGDVTSDDVDCLLEYIVESRDDLGFIYNDSNGVVRPLSAITNWLAADANGDNKISLTDVTKIQDLDCFVDLNS